MLPSRATHHEPPPHALIARHHCAGWCLLEVSAALEKRHELHISLSAADRAGLDRIILLRLEELTDIVAAVDVNDAQISLEADRDFLLRKMVSARFCSIPNNGVGR